VTILVDSANFFELFDDLFQNVIKFVVVVDQLLCLGVLFLILFVSPDSVESLFIVSPLINCLLQLLLGCLEFIPTLCEHFGNILAESLAFTNVLILMFFSTVFNFAAKMIKFRCCLVHFFNSAHNFSMVLSPGVSLDELPCFFILVHLIIKLLSLLLKRSD